MISSLNIHDKTYLLLTKVDYVVPMAMRQHLFHGGCTQLTSTDRGSLLIIFSLFIAHQASRQPLCVRVHTHPAEGIGQRSAQGVRQSEAWPLASQPRVAQLVEVHPAANV